MSFENMPRSESWNPRSQPRPRPTMRRSTLWAGITAKPQEFHAFSAMIPENSGGGDSSRSEVPLHSRDVPNCSSTPSASPCTGRHRRFELYRRGNPGEKRRRLSLFRVEAVRQWLARR